MLRPDGLFAFSGATPLAWLAFDEAADAWSRDAAARLLRHAPLGRPRGLGRVQPADRRVDPALPRERPRVEDLIEVQPPEGATSTYRDEAATAWARRWPMEQIWKVRGGERRVRARPESRGLDDVERRVHRPARAGGVGARARSRGGSGRSPSRRRGCCRTSAARTWSSSAAAPRTSRRGSRGAARGRSASTSRRRSSRPRAACRTRPGSSSRSSRRTREATGLPDESFDLAVSEYGASIWCDPYRWIPEAARLLRPGGELVFLVNAVLLILCSPDDGLDRGASACGRSSGCTASTGAAAPTTGSSTTSATASWIAILRDSGFELLEPRRAAGAAPTRATTATTTSSPPTGRAAGRRRRSGARKREAHAVSVRPRRRCCSPRPRRSGGRS